MNSKFQRANAWSKVVIGAAIEVHTLKGGGLIESIYERCILREFELREVPVLSQLDVEIEYKDRSSSVTGICYPLFVVPFDWPSLGNQFIRTRPLGVTVNGGDDHEFVGASAVHMFQQFFS